MTTADLDLHAHDHNFLGSTHDENARRTLWVVALTTVMMVGEIVAGTVFGSMALLADGFHMATHAGALAVAAGAYAFARRYATDPRFARGHQSASSLPASDRRRSRHRLRGLDRDFRSGAIMVLSDQRDAAERSGPPVSSSVPGV